MSKFERTIDQAHIDAEAAQLRVGGLTYTKIADRMDCSVSTAFERVQRAIAAVPVEAVTELRAIELERLDSLLKVAMDSVLVDGKIYNIDRCLAIAERRAKLLGLDAPTRTIVNVITQDVAEAALQEILREEALAELAGGGELRDAATTDRGPEAAG